MMKTNVKVIRILVFISFSLLSMELMAQLDWPLRQAEGVNHPGYYDIGDFTDYDPDTTWFDHNMMGRTRNGHSGIDIGIGPFGWRRMDLEEVDVIAAHDAIIVATRDGEFDRECNIGDAAVSGGNMVRLVSMDTTLVTAYFHLKNGTVTTKVAGDTVLAGEYLGKVGSSGSSNGPHLHFGVKDSVNNVLVDPFQGTLNPVTLWNNQLPYFDSGINQLMTHSANWKSQPCPMPTLVFESDKFERGDSIIFSGHFRDHLQSDTTFFWVTDPNGQQAMLNDVYVRKGGSNYRRSVNQRYPSTIPVDAPYGKWTFHAQFNTTTYGPLVYEKHFFVCDGDLMLSGTHNVDSTYSSFGVITSTADVDPGVDVYYFAGTRIELTPGFNAPPGSIFEAKQEVCGM